MAKVKVTVIGTHEIRLPDGTVEWRSKSPVSAPPAGKVWHPAIGEFIDEGTVEPFEVEIEGD